MIWHLITRWVLIHHCRHASNSIESPSCAVDFTLKHRGLGTPSLAEDRKVKSTDAQKDLKHVTYQLMGFGRMQRKCMLIEALVLYTLPISPVANGVLHSLVVYHMFFCRSTQSLVEGLTLPLPLFGDSAWVGPLGC